jgi:hypothetical protein
MRCLSQVSRISVSARVADSAGAIIQPTTVRLKMSRMTSREKYDHVTGPRSFVMSHDQTWFGAVAKSSGF